ncbi:MAG: MATE family efflux transporter [Halobacteriota archaeon]
MADRRERMLAIWRRTIALSWPIAIQQTLNTLMRTVDLVVTGLFSPAAIAAVGLADLYAHFPLRVGLSLGTGAIALSSQDTGRGAHASRDRAITQALLIGFLLGIPLVAVGLLGSSFLIDLLGAESEVVRLGGLYLMLVFAASPMRITALVGARSLQGTGDTLTPMLINGAANVINIALTVSLGLGLFGLPRLEIVGVGIATAVARTFEAVVIVGAIASPLTDLGLARPRDATITKQLLGISAPTFAEGMSSSLAEFPFNSITLLFGTEANAAYHVGRRIYQQLGAPIYRSLSVASSVIVGQLLGEGKPDEARFAGYSITALGLVTLTAIAAVLFAVAEPVATVFTDDPLTREIAVDFVRLFTVAIASFGVFSPIAGSLRGAGDTRTPFYARISAAIVFLLGFSYVVGVVLGFGLFGVFAGLLLNYLWWSVVVTAGFVWGDWAERADALIAERAAAADD